MQAQWADDVHHALHVALTGETQGYYADFAAPGALTKVLEGDLPARRPLVELPASSRTARPLDRSALPGSRFVVSLQTHDQVGNRAHRRPALGRRSRPGGWPAVPRCC